MNIRILGSVLTIVAVVGGVTSVSGAFFSDTGTSTDNTFTTGSLDMKLTDNNETDQDNVTASFGINGGGPGATFLQDIDIKNTGTVDANHLDLRFNNSVTNAATAPGNEVTTPMDKVIEITELTWDRDADGIRETNLLALVTPSNITPYIDLDDIENFFQEAPDNFGNLDFDGVENVNHRLRIAGRYNPTDMTNEHIGDSVNTTVTFTMNQDGSQ